YNFLDLRRELEARGHLFRSHCDTEVLVHGYEEWGDALPERLCGMFAFAIWDARKRRLFLARDRLGKKPLYYHLGRERLSFGSERLRHAVEIRLMSDVPLGVFLSGGLDSSAIAAHMIDLRRETGGERVKSFSVGYVAEDGSSELDQARRVARALGTDHAEVVV